MTSAHRTDATQFREQAAQARWIAARALTDEDQKFWLRLADELHQLALQAELGRLSPATLQTIKRVEMMDHLLQSEHHVMRGEHHIERQREIVASLEKTDPQEAGRARELLAQFEEMQVMHIIYRDRLRSQLGKVEAP